MRLLRLPVIGGSPEGVSSFIRTLVVTISAGGTKDEHRGSSSASRFVVEDLVMGGSEPHYVLSLAVSMPVV